jgi:hypothetical protein
MKKIMIALLMAPSLTVVAEQLPDSAPPDDDAPQTREQLPALQLDGSELEAMYLESPRELDTSDENRGMNAVSPDTRYLEDEQQEMRQRQAENVRPPPLRDDTPPPPPPTLIPIREL